MNQVIYIVAEALRLLLNGLPLRYVNTTHWIVGFWCQSRIRSRWVILSDQMIRNRHDTCWATPAFIKRFIVRVVVSLVEGFDSLWIRMAKPVNRLINISHNRQRTILCKEVN